jgi:large subunit ribosomal protein L10
MKSRQQKQESIKRAEELLVKSDSVVFVDFSKVKDSHLRALRRELKNSGNPLFVIKKRLLGLIFKNKNMNFGAQEFKTSVGTIFVSNIESATSLIYKFFKGLEKSKKIEGQKILGGYDLKNKTDIPLQDILAMGQLPSREILLGQLLGMIAAPIRSFLYVLDQKSKQTVENK